MTSNSKPPPLPPRRTSRSQSPFLPADEPPPYTSLADDHLQASPYGNDASWASQDPRSSSTQSLVPSETDTQGQRRKLLLIYIHGFMGDETSFRSFPAHVHRLLTVLMAETHVVHTKIYPRYRSRRNIRFARDDFSVWLSPHEASMTDVVLLGHSMGGLLSAEVVLMAPSSPESSVISTSVGPLKHRILGTINFDVPFLGMHPGVVKSGLASIFQSAEHEDRWSPSPGTSTPTDGSSISPVTSLGSNRTDTLWQPPGSDPNFNERFANDVVLPVRKGWRNALHFVHKHSKSLNELGKATQNLVTSHLEFGGAMANYSELKTRYARTRALEDDNENVRRAGVQTGAPPPRVRFVNYYTVSTGRVKKASPSPGRLNPSRNQSAASLSPEDARGRIDRASSNPVDSRSPSPRISLDEYSNEGIISKDPDVPDSGDENWEEAAESLTIGDPNDTGKQLQSAPSTSRDIGHDTISPVNTNASLPPLPELPPKPTPLETSPDVDPASRKLLEKEHARTVKAYEKALKNREKTMRDRKKFEEKQAKKADKDNAQPNPQNLEIIPTASTSSQGTVSRAPQSNSSSRSPSPNATQGSRKPKREHTFCSLPPKDSHGQRDSTWIRVFMENVDEVGAHCGLFFVDERYERLVGDVADRVERWVREETDRKFVAEDAVGELG